MTAPLTKERIELIANRAWKEAGWGDIHASGAEWHLCKTAVEVALRALSAPEEFVSAPREPTADMTAVMLQAIKDGMLINDDAERSIRHGYRAMLAAAPQAPAGEDQRASHCALKPNKNSANAGQMGTVQDKQVGDCTEAHPNAETLATCVAICAALCEPPKDTWDAGYNAGCRDYRDRIVRLIEHPPAPSGKWVSVPKEIDRAKHRAVLDVWNQCMAEAETLEMAWPKLVAAISAAPVNTASAWVSVKERLPESVERCAICGEAKSGHVPGGCACEIPMNLHSTQHEHEPQIPPTYDEEGRCLICVMLVEIRDIKTIAFHLGEDKKELQSKLSSALDAGKEGWNQFYALRKQIAEEKHPGMTQEVKANE